MPPQFEKLTNNSLRGRIADKVREAILDGTLAEGERLVERKLAQDFGASLTAVREALVELESDGFIAKLPNASTHVIRLTVEDAEKIVSVRGVLEGFAASEAARLVQPAQMQSLAELANDALAAAEAGDTRQCLHHDLALHETIWSIAGNPAMNAALRRIVLPIYAFFSIRMKGWAPNELRECAESNLPMVNAICSQDPDSARDALRYVLDRWMDKTRSVVSQQPPVERETPELKAALVLSPAQG